jgi:transcriptional regulator with GAF, ATPase, and Fis domain
MALSTAVPRTDLAEKRRILQLETLYDLALALHAGRPEQELVEELLLRVCTVLDPGAAVAVTRDLAGGARALASVGWHHRPPQGGELLAGSLWRELLAQGRTLAMRDGELCGRPYRELLATPLADREVYLGYLVLLDKEVRGARDSFAFTAEDRRFLDSVAALAAVALNSSRQLEDLETQRERLAEENKVLKGRLVEEFAGHRIVASAPPMRRVLEMVERVAPRGVNVLLRGESGTGKELVAKLLHSLSGRAGSLIALNCAALPESLLESELFGIEGGVATGVQARRGKFELAHRGTLFLDEIGDLQPPLQVKLLRALQEREIVKVGGQKSLPVDVRVVAATHRNLEALIAEGSFREDLYYRLKGVELELPPLRDRRQDVPLLVRYFIEEFCRREGLTPPPLSPEAQSLLLGYDYPGNVRELQNLVEGAVSLADAAVDAELLRRLIGDAAESAGDGETPLDLRRVERRHIERVLRMTDGNKSTAAQLLGLDRRTLQRKGF